MWPWAKFKNQKESPVITAVLPELLTECISTMVNTCEALEAAVMLTMTYDLIRNPSTYLRSINYSKSFSWAPFSFDFLCSKVNLSFLLPRKFQALLKIPHRAEVFSHWYKFQLQMVRHVSLEGDNGIQWLNLVYDWECLRRNSFANLSSDQWTLKSIMGAK